MNLFDILLICIGSMSIGFGLAVLLGFRLKNEKKLKDAKDKINTLYGRK
jgi:hypothetical protein